MKLTKSDFCKHRFKRLDKSMYIDGGYKYQRIIFSLTIACLCKNVNLNFNILLNN